MAGDLRRLRGDRDKKGVPHCIVHACMNGLFFLTTELHRSFSSYITFTSLIHHFYIIPSAHTSLSSSVPFVHHPLPERADSGFSGCAGNASRPRNKLRPRSPFSDGKNAGNRTYPGWMVWISALCTCAHTHACRKNRACAFLAGFRVVCCLFYRFPVRNAQALFLRHAWVCAQVHSAEFHTVQPVEVLFPAFFSSENGERGRNLLRDREALARASSMKRRGSDVRMVQRTVMT